MVSLPIVTVRLPSDLVGLRNGDLPANLLVPIGPRGQLHRNAARAWRALHAAAAADGIALTYTYGGTYRPLTDQVALFDQRYTTVPQKGRPTKSWKGTTYWQLAGTAMAAVPGTSNHGLGLAVDTALGSGPDHATTIAPQLAWLVAHAPAFGWSWENAEIWHIRLVTGNDPTAAVLAYEASTAAPGPAPVESLPPTATPVAVAPSLRALLDEEDTTMQYVADSDTLGSALITFVTAADNVATFRMAGFVDADTRNMAVIDGKLNAVHWPDEVYKQRAARAYRG